MGLGFGEMKKFFFCGLFRLYFEKIQEISLI